MHGSLGRTDLRTSAGRYVLFGARGNTRVAVTKSAYDMAVKNQVVASHQAIDFDLALAKPRADVSGRYLLTITVAPECRVLAAEFHSRSFASGPGDLPAQRAGHPITDAHREAMDSVSWLTSSASPCRLGGCERRLRQIPSR
jgi:hypothetical protein